MTNRREIAPTLLIDTEGRFLLQRRDDVPHILYPGRIGFFGGHREGEESFLECAVREVEEELSYYVPPERFRHLGSREYHDSGTDQSVHAEFFLVREVPVEQLTITEGSLFIVGPREVASVQDKLTPSARLGMDLFAGKLTGC